MKNLTCTLDSLYGDCLFVLLLYFYLTLYFTEELYHARNFFFSLPPILQDDLDQHVDVTDSRLRVIFGYYTFVIAFICYISFHYTPSYQKLIYSD